MTTDTALLLIDLQNGVMAATHDRDGVIANIQTLIDRARTDEVPVVWVQHSSDELPQGSESWQFVPELVRDDAEPLVPKTHGDSFEDTDLAALLADQGVRRLVVAGAQTDGCVRATLHGAFVRGYDVTLVVDAHTTEDLTEWGAPPPDQVISHTNLYWRFQTAPGRQGQVVPTADVRFTTDDPSA